MTKSTGIYLTLVLTTSLLVGCDDGTVVVKGNVEVDGELATNGQLVLNPVGKGPRGFGHITEDGSFQLLSPGSKKGIPPGSYHVLYKHHPQLSDKARRTIEKRAAGLSIDELSVSYLSPKKEPVVVPEEGTENLQIAINRKDGWTKIVSD